MQAVGRVVGHRGETDAAGAALPDLDRTDAGFVGAYGNNVRAK
jgi:hypothetical protein